MRMLYHQLRRAKWRADLVDPADYYCRRFGLFNHRYGLQSGRYSTRARIINQSSKR